MGLLLSPRSHIAKRLLVRCNVFIKRDAGYCLPYHFEGQILQLLVEGGPRVAHDFHAAGLVDRYVVYLAPALFGGSDGRPLLDGPGARSIDEVWRGRALSVDRLGEDLRIVLAPAGDLRASAAASALAGVEAGR